MTEEFIVRIEEIDKQIEYTKSERSKQREVYNEEKSRKLKERLRK